MPKNRFNTRSSYDSSFRYGESEISQKSFRKITFEQTDFLKKLYHNRLLNPWEKEFIKTILKSNHISEKQSDKIRDIHRLKNK